MTDNNKSESYFVYAETQKVGTITFSSSLNFDFSYDKTWIKSGYALSPHLPLREHIEVRNILRFIKNLLPEGTGLEILRHTFLLSRHNIAELIKHIASDTAGIVHFESPDVIEPELRELSEQELTSRVSVGSNVVLFDGVFRLGVAGVQKKLNVYVKDDGTFLLGNTTLTSTHILKFEPKASYLVLNELFCMRLAQKIGLPVAATMLQKLVSAERQYYTLVVKRFDREILEDGSVSKRHIIDGCQALNLPPEHKYELIYGSNRDVERYRDGANLPQLFDFTRQHCQSEDAIYQLLVWVCFNLVIGNSDAHAKNISFYVDQLGIQLAPFYDLVSIVFEAKDEPKLDTSLAMAIGDEFDINAITAYHLLCFAEKAGIPPEQLKNVLSSVATACIESASVSLCHDTDLLRLEKRFLVQLIALIKQRATHFLHEVTLFDEIQRTLF